VQALSSIASLVYLIHIESREVPKAVVASRIWCLDGLLWLQLLQSAMVPS
jgi:hypothetical protein